MLTSAVLYSAHTLRLSFTGFMCTAIALHQLFSCLNCAIGIVQSLLERSEKERDSAVHARQSAAVPKISARNSPSPAHSKGSKPHGLAYPYGSYASAKTPPVYAEDSESRQIKRESSPAVKRLSAAHSFSKVGDGTLRASDGERSNRLKRKSEEPDDMDRFAGREATTKRKREITAGEYAPVASTLLLPLPV